MAQPCLFCPEKATTKEHIIPKWLAKACGLRGAYLGATTPDARAARHQPISFKSHRKRFFCAECQTHFKHLEDAAKPFVEPMCQRSPIELDAEAQRIVARWFAKTGIALIASEPKSTDTVPSWQRYVVRQGDSPADGMWVGVAMYDGLAQKDVQTSLDDEPGDAEDEPRMLYSGVLSFGWIAFKLFGVDKTRAEDRWYRYADVTQLWPPDTPLLNWPPRRGVRGPAFEYFKNLIPLVGYGTTV